MNAKIAGGTTAELRKAAEQLSKKAEQDSSIFSGDRVRPEDFTPLTQK
jgi:hypothetical protein